MNGSSISSMSMYCCISAAVLSISSASVSVVREVSGRIPVFVQQFRIVASVTVFHASSDQHIALQISTRMGWALNSLAKSYASVYLLTYVFACEIAFLKNLLQIRMYVYNQYQHIKGSKFFRFHWLTNENARIRSRSIPIICTTL